MIKMPYRITKLNNNKFQVKNTKTKKITAKGTCKSCAEKQVRLLNKIDKKKY